MEEILIIFVVGAAVLFLPLAALITAIVALVRLGRVQRRLNDLESRFAGQPVAQPTSAPARPIEESEIVAAEIVTSAGEPTLSPESQRSPFQPASTGLEPAGLESFIGQKAFGWMAVVLFVFATAFFLRYAYQNNWIGPVGRVAIAEMAGAALVAAGLRYHRQGWKRFSNMLTSAGMVVLYLATYSAFGFYHLLPQRHAGVFLAILVIESMVAAVLYRSTMTALVSVIGGLATPLLMHSIHDTYTALFLYLAVFNAAVVVAHLIRPWHGVASLACVGTHGLFWMWYHANYHPEKFAWALGFEVFLFGLYLFHTVAGSLIFRRQASWEPPIRLLVNSSLGFAAFHVLVRYDYRMWLGSLAMSMALVHAITAYLLLRAKPRDERLLLTALAIAVGFLAWTFPLQADADWVALGWAAMAAALWRFGVRISSTSMRLMAAGLFATAILRLLVLDLPLYTRDPFVPIFNEFALPSLGVVGLLLWSVLTTERHVDRISEPEQWGLKIASVIGVGLLWIILSVECYGYFDSRSIGTSEVQLWRWRGQLALTVLWTLLASMSLAAGFRFRRVRLRWIGIALLAITVLKLFFVDMANVQQLYRILAFLVLSIVLALVARMYQRLRKTPS